uniref:Reverse transcriptase domain-containing protein n=1 Tax=Mola mola TaxID=94237 RepID=A0A3Q3WJC5_MOLML
MTVETHENIKEPLSIDEQSVEFIKNEILDYWLKNEGSVSNPGVEWDAFKAVIKGQLIQHYNPSIQDISSFLSSVKCPTLSREEQGEIGADITLEVKKAIQDVQGGKSPGGGCLPAEFYKTFSDLLALKLLRVFKDSLERDSLPDIMQNAITTLIYKKDRDHTKLGLSLLGKINILKMAIVPKINYISNMLPLSLPRNALLKYNEAVYNVLWAGKKPYINRTKLYTAIEDGGLGLPHITWYHYAFCLKQLSKLYMTADQAPAWVGIEKDLTYPLPDAGETLAFTPALFSFWFWFCSRV